MKEAEASLKQPPIQAERRGEDVKGDNDNTHGRQQERTFSNLVDLDKDIKLNIK